MPVWEAIGRLAGRHPSQAVSTLLDRHAAAQAAAAGGPALAPAAPLPNATPPPPGRAPRGMSERLLREMTDALEALAAETPVVLVLEDVHWADYSTLDLISALARRHHSPARLLVLATYRPEQLAAGDHPLRAVVQGLMTASLCREIALPLLDEMAVGQYLTARFDHAELPSELATRLHQRTDGHPLFLVHVVDDLIEQGVLTRDGDRWRLTGDGAWLAVLETQVPRTVRAMIELQLERLDAPERGPLEAAAVAGVEFSAAAVAAALEGPDDVVAAEQACERLSRRHRFLEPRGVAEWPDGTAATHYRFVHELNHSVVYERIPAAKRARMHRSVGQRLEAAFGARAAEEAAALAMHAEAGRDWPRAVRHLRQAATAAARQYAHREAVRYLRRAHHALGKLAEAERAEHELPMLMSLGVNLQVTDGFGATEFRQIYSRALDLCGPPNAPARDAHEAFPALFGIWMFHKVRSQLREADEVARRMLAAAERSGDAALLVQAHQSMCVTHLCLGNLPVAKRHMDAVVAAYDPARHAGNAEVYGQDPLVVTLSFGSIALWLMGEADEALAARDRAARRADELRRPSTLALASYFTAMLHQLRGDAPATRAAAERTMQLAEDDGFTFWLAGGRILRGWAAAVSGEPGWGLTELQSGQDTWRTMGSRTYHTYHLGLRVDVLLRLGETREALKTLDEAIAAARDLPEGFYEAELHRLKGIALRDASPEEAKACYATARRFAEAQGAKWFLDQIGEDDRARKKGVTFR